MKKIILGLIFLISATSVFSEDGVYKLKGFVGKAAVTMNITEFKGKIVGSYYYNKYGQPISISGERKNNNIEVGEEGGKFNGEVLNGSYSGNWVGENKKIVKFKLDMKKDDKFKVIGLRKEDKYSKMDFFVIIADGNDISKQKINKFLTEPIFNKDDKNIIKTDTKTVEAEIKKLYESLNADAKDILTESDREVQLEHIVSEKINFENERYISLCLIIYAYEGGAHGMYGESYITIDKKTGKRVMLEDIFIKNNKQFLTDKITKSLLAGSESKDLSEEGYFVEKAEPNDNYYITEKGIGFYYNQYEIASYANGTKDVFIPFSDIENRYYNKNGEFYSEIIKRK